METKTYQVYSFNELSENAKQNALEKNRYWNVKYVEWYDFTIEDWTSKLKAAGFTNTVIQFSGFSSQGDGARFTGGVDEDVLFNTLIYCAGNNYKQARLAEKALLLWENDLLSVTISKNRISHYVHEGTVSVSVDYYGQSVWDSEYWSDFIEQVENMIDDYRRDLCHAIYKDLETEYEWLTGDEQIIESFEANEIMFRENGDID